MNRILLTLSVMFMAITGTKNLYAERFEQRKNEGNRYGKYNKIGLKNEGDEHMNEVHTVMVILESKQGKELLLKNALMKVAEQSRQEDSCLEYRLYQDKENPFRFGLYEKWKSKELHQQQFSKSYIVDFAKQAETLLEKPFEVVFGKEVIKEDKHL